MAKNNTKQDYNAMSIEDLRSNIAESTLRLKKLKFNHAISPIDNPLTIRAARKEVARMQTALKAK
jgi:large subunit ribosomal protein L29